MPDGTILQIRGVGVRRGSDWQEIDRGTGVQQILDSLVNAKAVQSNLNGYQCGYQNSILDQKRKKPLIYNGFLGFTGGNEGIRTLDEAQHPILP